MPLELKREVLAEKISSKDESPKQDIVTPSKVIDVQEGEQSDDAMSKPIVSTPVNTGISESAKSRSATIKEETLNMDLQDKTVFDGQKDAKGKIASETKKNVAKKESKKIADTLKKYDTLKKDTILRKTKN